MALRGLQEGGLRGQGLGGGEDQALTCGLSRSRLSHNSGNSVSVSTTKPRVLQDIPNTVGSNLRPDHRHHSHPEFQYSVHTI